MIVDTPGKITDRILMVGRKEICAYLVKGGDEYAIIGGGMAYIIPDVLEQLRRFDIKEEKIQRIIILHSHFDHCGMVPYLKKRWPWATVTASARARELLTKKKVEESIRLINQALIEQQGLEEKTGDMRFEFTGIDVEEIAEDGDIIPCGDLNMEIIAVPGHSYCSIAVYIAEEKALFASDAGGIPFGDKIFTAANSNFDKYQKSLEKMATFDVDIHLAEHNGARTGKEGRNFLARSIETAAETRKVMEESYRRNRDIEKSIEDISGIITGDGSSTIIPMEIVITVVRQMLRYVARQVELSET